MSWDRDPLWAKARLYFQRAFGQSRDDPVFGLWCSLGLEVLARAALASVSPTLLAEPDRDHKYLLHALGRGSARTPRKSIGAAQVLALCGELFPEFTQDDVTAALALVNRRNEELHSGAAAFHAYPSTVWLAGFYRACQSLATAMDESLTAVFGEDEAQVATLILDEDRKDVRQRVEKRIQSHRTVFQAKTDDEQKNLQQTSEKQCAELAYKCHHRVGCPACGCTATVQGTPFGKENVADEDGNVVVRQAVSPSSFVCSACGMKLEGYAELETAGLGGHYTRRTTFSPDEYYGLIHPDDLPSYMEEYLAERMEEYDNE